LDSTRRLAFALALCLVLPCAVSAQRMDARKSGVGAVRVRPIYGAERSGFTEMPSAGHPSLERHTLYGTLAGAVLWGVYFALPCDGDCDGSRAQRFILLPAFAGIGASAGFLTGLLRGGR
jgi:predicted secreted protein